MEVEARDSSVFVKGFDSWSGNTDSLISQLMGHVWDFWLPPPPEAQLKETRLICGSVPFFVRWTYQTWVHIGGKHWPYARPVPGGPPLCIFPAVTGEAHWELLHTPPHKLTWQSSVPLHPWILKGSGWRGAQGPLLQPSQLAVLRSAFSDFFSSWRLCCGAGAPAERDPTLVFV